MFNLTRELAADCARIDVAYEAIDMLDAAFDLDVKQIRLLTMGTAVSSRVPVAEKQKILAEGLILVDDLLETSEYETSKKVASRLLDISQRAKDKEFVEAFSQREKYAQSLELSFSEIKDAIRKLETNPEDAAANFLVGKFRLFKQGNWRAAMPNLVHCSDAKLAAIAKAELANPLQAAAEKSVADDWWNWSESAKDEHQVRFARARAAFWYSQALNQLEGIDKVTTIKRLEECQGDVAAFELPEHYLDDMEETNAVVGFGSLAKHGLGFQDSSPKPTFQGKLQSHSLYMHAKSRGTAYAKYQLSRKYDYFEGTAGLWDYTDNPVSPVVFQIVGDDKVLWTSTPMQRHGIGQPFRVDISGVKVLTIGVHCAGEYIHAHCVWLNPKVSQIPDVALIITDGFGIGTRHFQ